MDGRCGRTHRQVTKRNDAEILPLAIPEVSYEHVIGKYFTEGHRCKVHLRKPGGGSPLYGDGLSFSHDGNFPKDKRHRLTIVSK